MYAKTTWVNAIATPLNQTNLNHLETQSTLATVIGEILIFPGTTHTNPNVFYPTGDFLMCDGAIYDGTVGTTYTFPELYAVTSKMYGIGNGGAPSFNVPDLRGKYPVGLSGAGDYSTMGKTGGSSQHVLTLAELPSHRHGYESYNLNNPWGFRGVNGMGDNSLGSNNTIGSGSDAAHENRPQSIVMNYIIRYR